MSVGQVAISAEMVQKLIVFVQQRVGKANTEIHEDTPLVSSGLIDSFGLIEVFLELQRIAGLKVPASKVQAKDMDTVRLMFATAERFGKPARK
jgi:acyl carrier protein